MYAAKWQENCIRNHQLKKQNIYYMKTKLLCFALLLSTITTSAQKSASSATSLSVSAWSICDSVSGGKGLMGSEATGGTRPYNFKWSTGDTSNNIYGMVNNGLYTVTVKDAMGASATASVNLNC